MRLLSVCVLLGMLLPLPALAKRTMAIDGPLTLKLRSYQLTVVVLPEPSSSITSPYHKELLQITDDGQYVMFVLNAETLPAGRVAIIGATSSQLYLIDIQVTSSGGDDEVHIIQKAPAKVAPFTDVSMMRKLIQGQTVAGAEPLTLPVPTPPDGRVHIAHVQGISLGKYQGMTAVLTNTQAVPLLLDIRTGEAVTDPQPFTIHLAEWAWPPRREIVLIRVDEDVVQPGASTRLLVVFEERLP